MNTHVVVSGRSTSEIVDDYTMDLLDQVTKALNSGHYIGGVVEFQGKRREALKVFKSRVEAEILARCEDPSRPALYRGFGSYELFSIMYPGRGYQAA